MHLTGISISASLENLFRRHRLTPMVSALATALLVACGGGGDSPETTAAISEVDHDADAEIYTASLLASIDSEAEILAEDSRRKAYAVNPATGIDSPVYYIDGANGSDANDGLSEARPLRTFNKKIVVAGNSILLKRGTTIIQAVNIWPKNTFIGAYGSSSLPKPVLQVQEGTTYQISADSGEFHIRDIEYRASQQIVVGSGINGAKASRLIVDNCIVVGFTNGIRFNGSNGRIRGNTVSGFTGTGIFGGRFGSPAPSNYEISYNKIDSSKGKDGISLHDGDGAGTGNIIKSNSIVGGSENGIDILGMYPQTTIEKNVIRDTKLAAIIVSMGDDGLSGAHDSKIVGNSISRSTTAGIYSRADRATIAGNVLYKMYNTGMSSGIVISGSATVLDNKITVPSNVSKPAIMVIQAANRPKPTGTLERNSVTLSTLEPSSYIYHFESDIATGWRVDANTYSAPYNNGIYFDGFDFNAWRSKNWGGVQPAKDRNSTFASVTSM